VRKFDISDWEYPLRIEVDRDEFVYGTYYNWDNFRRVHEEAILSYIEIDIPWGKKINLMEYMKFLNQDIFRETKIIENFGLDKLEIVQQANNISENYIQFPSHSHDESDKFISAIFDFCEVPSGTDYEFGFQYEHERYKENPLEFTTYEQTIDDIHEKVNKTFDNLIKKSLILTSLIFTESLLKSVISSKIPEETEITSFSNKIIKDEINANLQGDGEIREKFFRKLFDVSAPEQPWRDLRKSLTRGIDSTKIQENKIVYTAYRENESVEMIEPIDELFEKLITFCNELQQIVINDSHSL